MVEWDWLLVAAPLLAVAAWAFYWAVERQDLRVELALVCGILTVLAMAAAWRAVVLDG